MRFGIYRCEGTVSRSVLSAVLVAEVDLDEWPDDDLVESYGGDFIQLIEEEE